MIVLAAKNAHALPRVLHGITLANRIVRPAEGLEAVKEQHRARPRIPQRVAKAPRDVGRQFTKRQHEARPAVSALEGNACRNDEIPDREGEGGIVDPRVDLGAFGYDVDRLEADAEAADLVRLAELGCVANSRNAVDIVRREMATVVLEHDRPFADNELSLSGSLVLGVLHELEQEVRRIGILLDRSVPDTPVERVFLVRIDPPLPPCAEFFEPIALFRHGQPSTTSTPVATRLNRMSARCSALASSTRA